MRLGCWDEAETVLWVLKTSGKIADPIPSFILGRFEGHPCVRQLVCGDFPTTVLLESSDFGLPKLVSEKISDFS